MDWTTIVVAVVSAMGGGAVQRFFTRHETKEGMSLDNMQKVLDAKDRIIEEREERCKELKQDLDKKDAKIDEMYKEKDMLRHELDEANTRAAVAEVIVCDRMDCGVRNPPLGSRSHFGCKGCDSINDKSKVNGKGDEGNLRNEG